MKRLVVSVSACLLAAFVAAGTPVAPVAAQAATGTIEGHVTVTGPSPANPVIRMGMDPLCARANRPGRPRQAFVVRGPEGQLANVFVALDGSFPDTPVPQEPVVINQRKCQYAPRVVGARVGQTLRIINSDTLLHNLHSQSKAGNEFNETQPHSDMVFNYVLEAAEQMLHLKCDVHSWMSAYVGVMSHPYFAVTGEDGMFTIANVPAGRQTIHAWQERFGRLTKTVDVKPGTTTVVNFDYTGKEKPTATAGHVLFVPMPLATLASR